MDDQKIYIIGAGLSGLVAALELEKSGYSPIILEASGKIGGRVKTDMHDGFILDRGFQVLLTAYPEAKRYLNLYALNLKTFEPGAVIFDSKDVSILSDPLRNPFKLLNMAFSSVGSFSDKIKLFRLTLKLKKKSIEEIFEAPSLTTLQYLKNQGFSDLIISNFFGPFFRGVFLEKHLNTSSRMFEFIFKMFSEGHAAVPELGMGEIPKMLRQQLSKTQIYFNTAVKKVEMNTIVLANGDTLEADRILVCTQPDAIMDQLKGQFSQSKSVITLYFSTLKTFMLRPMLGLISTEAFLINNFVFMDDVSPAYGKEDSSLLSVSILESNLPEEELIKQVKLELAQISGIKAQFFKFIKSYYIPHALPQVDDPKAFIPATECKITDKVFLGGDYLLNGSINAAMTSGRLVAEAVVRSYTPVH